MIFNLEATRQRLIINKNTRSDHECNNNMINDKQLTNNDDDDNYTNSMSVKNDSIDSKNIDINCKSQSNYNYNNLGDSLIAESDLSTKVRLAEQEEIEILTLLTKLSVVTIACAIFAQFYNLTALYVTLSMSIDPSHNNNEKWYNWHELLCFIFRSIGALIDCSSLYMAYTFGEVFYFKFYNLCHETAKKYCTRYIRAMTEDLNQAGGNTQTEDDTCIKSANSPVLRVGGSINKE